MPPSAPPVAPVPAAETTATTLPKKDEGEPRDGGPRNPQEPPPPDGETRGGGGAEPRRKDDDDAESVPARDPPADDDAGVDGGGEGEGRTARDRRAESGGGVEGAVEGAASASPAKRAEEGGGGRREAAGAAAAVAKAAKAEKKKKRGRRPMIDEDAARLLSVLLRWVVLFSLLLIAASRWREGAEDARESATREERRRALSCERMRDHHEACYGDAGASGGSIGGAGGDSDLAWHVGKDQCPAAAEDHCHPRGAAAAKQTPETLEALLSSAVGRLLLVLGFPSPASLRAHVRESLLSALCWSATFVFVRKGLNPDERRANFASGGSRHYPNVLRYRYWRGAGYGGLGVFHSAFLRGVVKNHFSRETFLRQFASFMPLTPFFSQDTIKGPIYDAFMIGLCWGLAQFLVRRRLDPKTNARLLRRNWRDVTAGSAALSAASLCRAVLKRWSPACPRPLPAGLADAIRIGLCWGPTFLFVRRGLNPETNARGYVAKYRTDAVCGSLAMFAFALLKPPVRRLVVTYLDTETAGGANEEGAMTPSTAEEGGWAMCSPTISFASME